MRRWRKKMASSSCVSTGIRRSRTFELLSWDYGSSRIPSLPGRSALSTGPPCAPSHRHYGRTGLVQAVTNAILPNNHRLLLFHPLEPRNDYVFDGTRLESVDTLLLSPTTISSSPPPPETFTWIKWRMEREMWVKLRELGLTGLTTNRWHLRHWLRPRRTTRLCNYVVKHHRRRCVVRGRSRACATIDPWLD